MSNVTVARALTAHFARRIVRIATIGVLIIFGVITLIAGALAYFFSPWWWLLVVPAVLLLVIYFVVRLVVLFVVRRIHTDQLSKEQSDALEQFVTKVQMLLEARATPFPIIVLICLKDLVIHRDITTVKNIIRDSTSLMADYKAIEKLFSTTVQVG